MPKIIDHEQRAERIANAAMCVVRRDGIGKLSVRSVADEAGLAVASLRRAFPTQASLRVFCMELVSKRVQARIDALDRHMPAFDMAVACMRELLPLDDERRTEMETFLALGALAQTDPLLSAEYRRAHAAVSSACAHVLSGLLGKPELAEDPRRAPVRELHALLDGLALHLLRQPPHRDTSWAVALLAGHLRRLVQEPDTRQGAPRDGR